jgi:hypothetical protein
MIPISTDYAMLLQVYTVTKIVIHLESIYKWQMYLEI